MAGPEGAKVVNGEVSFQQSGYNTTITASDKAIINYSSFDIAKPEIVEFIQPSSQASVLNRINSAMPTNIEGTLLANGRVFFVNPAGVYIGEGARINVNQLVASGLNISDADFINGRMNFVGGDGTVTNRGDIIAEKAYLIGKHVVNSGNISCPGGYVVMAAGERVFLHEQDSDILVEFDHSTFSEPSIVKEDGPSVLNEGTVTATGGRITLAAGDIYSQAISNIDLLAESIEIVNTGQVSNTGTIEARNETASGGSVIVKADEVINSGTIDVTGSEGGEVTIEATERLGQLGIIHADGTTGNGGNVELRADDVVALSADSLTTANAGTNGDGGEVVVYSPDTALFHDGAKIEAKGGTESGDGGFIEVSGKKHIEVFGQVNASAEAGEPGTFLIDPINITIRDSVGAMDPGLDGTFTPSCNASTISDDAIEEWLNNGVNVEINASYDDTKRGNITQEAEAPIDKTSGGDATIKLVAHDITLDGGIISESGKLGVILDADGDVILRADITTNGGDFASFGEEFHNMDGSISTDGGTISIEHTGNVAVYGIYADSGSVSIEAGGGLTQSEPDEYVDITGSEISLTVRNGTIGPIEVSASEELNATILEGEGDIIISSGSGKDRWDLPIGYINAGTGNIILEASAIRDAVDDSDRPRDSLQGQEADVVDIVGNTVELTATESGIGTPLFVFNNRGKLIQEKDGVLEIMAGGELTANSNGDPSGDSKSNPDILISSVGDLLLGNICSKGIIDIKATGGITVAGGEGVKIEAKTNINLHAGENGTGDLSFQPEATLHAPEIVLRAGDGYHVPDDDAVHREAKIDGIEYLELDYDYTSILPDTELSLTIRQDASIDDTPSQIELQPDEARRVDLILQSDDGHITCTTADEWSSVQATAFNGIMLKGAGDITTNELWTNKGNIILHSTGGDLIVNGNINAYGLNKPPGGGVELLADSGRIYSGDSGTLNVSITGYSNDLGEEDPMGVKLPGGTGRAGIVIVSRDSLHLGPEAELKTYRECNVDEAIRSYKDDRDGVYFMSGPPGYARAGDPFDVSVYLASTGRDVIVDSEVSIYDNRGGAMVVDAKEKISFGNVFAEHWVYFGFPRLEVVSRSTQTLDQAARYETLPGAEEILDGRMPTWIVNVTGDFDASNIDPQQDNTEFVWSKYVLRGKTPGQVLAFADVFAEPSEEWRNFPRGFKDEAMLGFIDIVKEKIEHQTSEQIPNVPPAPLPDKEPQPGEIKNNIEQKPLPVKVTTEKGVFPAYPEKPTDLQTGNIIETPEDALCVIKFSEDTDIIVEPNTSITIGDMAVSITFGKIWFLGKADPNRPFVITTPNGDIRITVAVKSPVCVIKDNASFTELGTSVKIGPVLFGELRVCSPGIPRPFEDKDVGSGRMAILKGKKLSHIEVSKDALEQTDAELKDRLNKAPQPDYQASKLGPWPFLTVRYTGDRFMSLYATGDILH
jgi:filamentous hemagglutinin family protein